MGQVVKLPQLESWKISWSYFCLKRRLKVKLRELSTIISFMSQAFLNALRSEKELRASILKYFSDDIKPATFNLHRKYLKAFFDFLVRENVIEKNPVDFILLSFSLICFSFFMAYSPFRN